MRAQIAASSGRFALNREIPVCAGLHHAVLHKHRFPGSVRKGSNWRGFAEGFVSVVWRLDFRGPFEPLVSGAQNRVSRLLSCSSVKKEQA
jgi:hypothetical protein